MQTSTAYQIVNSMHFAWIAIFGAGMLALSMIFGGGDHEVDHDTDHDTDHDHGGGEGGNMSFLSLKVLWMFMVGFGAGGFFCARSGSTVVWASMGGLFFGFVMAGLGYFVMNYLYKHQGNSVVNSQNTVGLIAIVDTSIMPGMTGEVRCVIGGRSEYFQASSNSSKVIPASARVKVLEANGATLVVESIVDGQ